jgi:hypothetical protein
MHSARVSAPRRASFDPVAVGRYECAAWAAYYRHDWHRVLRNAVGMVSAGFLMNRRDTLLGAWLVLRANQAWAPLPDNDPAAARDLMRRFYRTVVDSGWGVFDPNKAAELEVEWWRLHRAHQYGQADASELTNALAALYSYVYDVPEEAVTTAAELRVAAMDFSDQWVRAGCSPADPLLAKERRALVASYTALRDSVERYGQAS